MTTSSKSRKTTDALAILRTVAGKSIRMETLLQRERLNAAVARQIHDARVAAGLSQRELAKLVGTSHSVINRLEDADYDGHSLSLLKRIAAALHHRIEVRLVPQRKAG